MLHRRSYIVHVIFNVIKMCMINSFQLLDESFVNPEELVKLGEALLSVNLRCNHSLDISH